MSLAIRAAVDDDRAAIVALYNHYVVHSPCTFDVEPFSVETRRAWFDNFTGGRHRLLVALDGARLVGYAGSMRFRPKAAYLTTVETTVYVAPDAHGRGVGARLYDALFAALADEDLHRAVAGVTLPNDASQALHRRFGFRPVGVFSEQGRKLGRYWDVAWLEKQL